MCDSDQTGYVSFETEPKGQDNNHDHVRIHTLTHEFHCLEEIVVHGDDGETLQNSLRPYCKPLPTHCSSGYFLQGSLKGIRSALWLFQMLGAEYLELFENLADSSESISVFETVCSQREELVVVELREIHDQPSALDYTPLETENVADWVRTEIHNNIYLVRKALDKYHVAKNLNTWLVSVDVVKAALAFAARGTSEFRRRLEEARTQAEFCIMGGLS